MTWRPGLPVLTPEDIAEWTRWRRARKLEQQRQRRATERRIDYYPGTEAAAVIDAVRGQRDYSRTIDSIILEWAGSGIK